MLYVYATKVFAPLTYSFFFLPTNKQFVVKSLTHTSFACTPHMENNLKNKNTQKSLVAMLEKCRQGTWRELEPPPPE